MRVVSVITRLNIGGVSPPVIALAQGLQERGHSSTIVAGTPEPDEGSMEAEAIGGGVEVLSIRELRRNPHPARDVLAARRLLRYFRERRPDVVATHMSKAGALGRLAARVAGVPVIVHTYHGKGFHVFDRRWKESAALTMERGLARVATGSIVVSEKQREEFIRLRVDRPDRLETIRYGLDLVPFLSASPGAADLRGQFNLPSHTRLVGVVGRLVNIKGQDIFLRASALLSARYPDVHFVLAGDGESRGAFEALARSLGLDNRVSFTGWRRDIPNILSELDVVALPTVNDFEVTPLAVIEALAAARPVVASDVGGVSEVVINGETGRLVTPRNVEALAAAIAEMLDAPEAAMEMARAGRRLALRHYQRDRMIDETERYFGRLLIERGRRIES